MMEIGDFCYHCDGTGERDFLSGARCYECNGTGWVEDRELTDAERDSIEDFWEEFYSQAETCAAPQEAAAATRGSGSRAGIAARPAMGTDRHPVPSPGRLGPADDDAAEPGAGVGGDVDAAAGSDHS